MVVCSLTRTAAAEIASRGSGVPRENVGTLHSLARRALGSPELVVEHLADWNERHPDLALGGVAADDDDPNGFEAVQRAATGRTRGDDLLGMADALRHRRVPRDAWPDLPLDFDTLWTEWKREHDLLDFTDLIEQALESVPVAPGAPEVLIVDEAQDSSVLELTLVREWAKQARTLVLAGDPDQAIFSWRGADGEGFLNPQIPGEQNYSLKQSYRVPRAVHAAAMEWLSLASSRHAVEYAPRDADGSIDFSGSRWAHPAQIIEAIEDAIEDERRVMLLASSGYMLAPLTKLLRDNGVPFHNPFRPKHGGWNPMRQANRLRAFLRPDNRTFAADERRRWSWDDLRLWTEPLAADKLGGPTGCKAEIVRRAEAERAAQSQLRDGRRVPPPDDAALAEVLGENLAREVMAIVAEARGDPVRWYSDRLLASWERQMNYPIRVAEKRGTSQLVPAPLVVIGTVHSVKGGEAEDVHIFPDLSPAAAAEWSGEGPGRDSIVRTFYVGLTRARRSVTIHAPSGYQSVPLGSIIG